MSENIIAASWRIGKISEDNVGSYYIFTTFVFLPSPTISIAVFLIYLYESLKSIVGQRERLAKA